MDTLLKVPGPNPTPRRVVRTAPGTVCLDTTCVTPACRWYTVEALASINSREAVAIACKTPELEPVQGCEPPPPMCIYPMPDQFPREVFLAAANYALELKRREIELQGAVSEAVADGQIPRAA